MMKSVLSGSSPSIVSTSCVPSTFETKCARRPSSPVWAGAASVAYDGPEVRPSDPDVHDVRDALPVLPLPGAGTERVGEAAHLGEDGVHLGHHVLPVDENRLVGAVPKRDVQDRTVLGAVDLLAAEHPVAPLGDLGLRGERQRSSIVPAVTACFE